MRVFDQDSDSPGRKRSATHNWLAFGLAMLIITAMSIMISWLVAGAVGASDDCRYTVKRGDTLSAIGTAHDVTWQRLAAINQLVDAHLIHPGDKLEVCHDRESKSRAGPVLVPGRLVEWAGAVQTTRPDWATDSDVRFLVAVSGPESNHGQNLWNPGDAGGPYSGSFGVIQIRVMHNPPTRPATDWYRNRAWLEQSFENQATAAWIVLGTQSRASWGPTTDGKLPADCSRSTNPNRCERWWSLADIAFPPG